MKIACIMYCFPWLPETFILNQITGLQDLGHNIHVFAKTKSNLAVDRVHEDFIKYDLNKKTTYLPTPPLNKSLCRMKALLAIFRTFIKRPIATFRFMKWSLGKDGKFSYPVLFSVLEILRYRFDIIHCHFGHVGIPYVGLKAAGINIKMLVSFHGADINSYIQKHGSHVYDDLFRYMDAFTANTDYTKQRMVENGCPVAKIRIIPESLRCKKFRMPPKKYSASETVNILTVGRLVEKKGYPYSLQAFAKVLPKHRNIKYWCVGDGPLMEEMVQLAKDLRIAGRVVFMGGMLESEVLEMYRKAHIFMLPSVTSASGDKEGQALVLQEAQMAALPVLSTIHNGIPEGILDGESGFLVPEKDVDALAEKLSWLLDNPQRWSEIGQAGQTFVENRYDTAIVSQKLVRIYQELLGQKG